MSKASASILACTIALLVPTVVRAEPAVLGLARAYLGPQSTLDGITSIHFVGKLQRVDPDHADKPPVVDALDMIFARPLRQRLVDRQDKVTRTTVLDGYDAWDWDQSNSDPAKFRLTWLSAADIKTLRANTWENLYYYSVPEGGSVVDAGPATVDGVACERVDFTHAPGIIYERYFDRDTGRLVLTVRGQEMIRESGEIRADGIRFAKSIVSTMKSPSGKDMVTTVTFDTVALNEPLAPDLFVVPSTAPRKAEAQPAAAAVGK
jgi:hypothetical protein